MSNWMNNPVLTKEIKLRFRSVKSYIGICSYLVVLGLLVLGYMGALMSFETNHVFQPSQSRMIFMMLCMFQLAMLIFITPGLTAGVISLERERQTLPILLTTDQSSSTIIISKMIASLAFLLLFVVLSFPLYVIVFLYGGISPLLVFLAFCMFLFTMIIIASIGVWASTVFRKTIVAIVTTYGMAFFMTGGFAILTFMLIMFGEVSSLEGSSYPWPFLLASINIPIMFFYMFEPSIFEVLLDLSGWTMSPWWIFISFYILLVIFLLITAIRKLRPRTKVKG
ncbi:ABC transporter permease [Alkalicoccobacillus murimartini]|uniref:ABC-type transport system involved in multi-copper enzyme maturation permease subunit n=1 Tax=Alkalicoccobacillus murimartini TaxID=171685 RepID=A0ABT9YE53_9BACI|nr:ABC transporter permease [Alkalicoccobacillus murimartini]MDQ0206118.1 ABC-type transport system involved in multi-copper enzyme maturation permease subunit [Alkalicoccobacillus murimartini]